MTVKVVAPPELGLYVTLLAHTGDSTGTQGTLWAHPGDTVGSASHRTPSQGALLAKGTWTAQTGTLLLPHSLRLLQPGVPLVLRDLSKALW